MYTLYSSVGLHRYLTSEGWIVTAETIEKELRKKYGEIVLEFGPGRIQYPIPGTTMIGLNPSADHFCDIYWDLEKGIPLPDKSVDEIHSNQFLEHISRDAFIYHMNEEWRVLRPGGFAVHNVPHFQSPWAFADPTHKNWFSEKSFDYFCVREDGTRFVEKFSDYGIEAAFILEDFKMRPQLDIEVTLRKPG
jgi:hypothetical protein